MSGRAGRRAGRRVSAMVAVLGVLVGGFVAAARTEPVTATFTDAEHAQGAFAAMTIQPAVTRQVSGQTCRLLDVLLGTLVRIELYWRFPPEYASYTTSNLQYGQVQGGVMQVITSNVQTTGDQTNGWTTTYSGPILTGILGSSVVVGIRVVHPSGWVSPWLRATASATIAGLNPQCSTSTDTQPAP